MKKVVFLTLAVLLAFGSLGVLGGCKMEEEPCEHVFVGSGTQEDPYLVGNEEDFRHIGCSPYSARGNHFLLTADLSYGNTDPFQPIARFSGVFDGDGHTIHLTYAYRNAVLSRVAVFDILQSATVKDTDFEVYLESTGPLYATAAGIAIDLDGGGLISGCSVSGSIKATGGQAYAAGLVDTVTEGRVVGCVSTAEVTAVTVGDLITNEDAADRGFAAACGLFETLTGAAESCYFAGKLSAGQEIPPEDADSDDVYTLIEAGVAGKYYHREDRAYDCEMKSCFYLDSAAEYGVHETGEGLTPQAEAVSGEEMRSEAFKQALNAGGNYFVMIPDGWPMPAR